ncbi:hypothetical protein [Alkalicoccobacillus plakortidis]|uniref:Uncharacterized protein n=1 Tax=Alkalicoccobacillus plakortidis TaxID=444060 RepID=A0ABT0XLK6_9BACI|nr:hypothetical protein [Alkalicoccobacillus plakortidis]MCM2676717.1 hypothetical protein [Alkalicoccobacillus plakortidis]
MEVGIVGLLKFLVFIILVILILISVIRIPSHYKNIRIFVEINKRMEDHNQLARRTERKKIKLMKEILESQKNTI